MAKNNSKQLVAAPKQVLIVDDEPDMLAMLRLVIEKKCDCKVLTAPSGVLALEIIEERQPDVLVSDIKMPDLDGLELLKRARSLDPTLSIVIMTGYGTIDIAVQALKDGAYDFLQKPFDQDHIIRVVKNGLERTNLLRTNIQLQQRLNNLSLPEGFIGQSPALKAALELLNRVADTDATVLIRGESGTGKELAARALHALSGRHHKKMVTVNCPALPENVLESELFGYSKGAFTGALKDKKGLFLEAEGSTILLDEIADIPVSVQTKLLRVLQEKEIQPLGQNKTIKVNVRVVASTNQDLEAKIEAGEFREDLFYRLNVVTVVMPSLEEMREDIPLLVHHFLSQFTQQYGREGLSIPTEVLQRLYQKRWQGNVRELRNSIKRLVLLAVGGNIEISDLSTLLPETAEAAASKDPWDIREYYHPPYNEAKAALISTFSSGYISNILTSHGGNVTNAAAACGLERQALQRLMRRYQIVSTDFKPKHP
ncbi:sigma-54-dependent transcriptional regulator [Desulfogranum mediterraneum]|uniref:sigma-54-dependent transcriptional regulator n=1 Tax=Desulfogranum mediterraneum TaxID=160661 RepID=UPI000429F688|nr:sigma-54 dependent transcriptional regulator [Desulfogranum mediterraneum]